MTPAPLPDAADLLQALNVAPSLKEALSVPHEFLALRHEKAQQRRFYEQPELPSGFYLTERFGKSPEAVDEDLYPRSVL